MDDSVESRLELSVVTSLYRSEAYVDEFYERVLRSVDACGIRSFEIIFVNDGSPDDSKEKVLKLIEVDEKVSLVDLSRNFGHHKALMTGLMHARGDKVFLIDCDLEEDPELLGMMLETMSQRSCDVVYGVMPERRGNLFNKLVGNLYFTFMNKISGINFPRNVLTARLMTKRYVADLIQHRERELLIGAIFHLTGYEQVPVFAPKHNTSPTTYSFGKKMSIALASMVSFSDRPLHLVFYLGLSISIISFFAIVFIFIQWLLGGVGVSGWTSLVLSVLFMGGMNMLFLGILGLYIGTIFMEAKQRPFTIVREVFSRRD